VKLCLINESCKISGGIKVSLNENLLSLSYTLADELLEHLQRVLWLIHGDHMSCIINSKELEVLVSSELSSSLSIDNPFSVGCLNEVLLTTPFDSFSPSFSTSPVADEVLISTVYKHLKTTLQDS